MKLLKIIGITAALALPATGASAATVTFGSPTPTSGTAPIFYVIDLFGAGFKTVSSVSILDDGDSRASETNPGFDVDGIGLFDTAPATAPSGGTTGDATFTSFTSGGPAVVNPYEGSVVAGGFVAIGNGATWTATAGSPLEIGVGSNQFLVVQDIGALDFLSSITVDGTIPVPAAGILLLSALGGVAAIGRRRRKTA